MPRTAIWRPEEDLFFMRKELPGAQIVFPEFGMAITLASIADEMAHNDGGVYGDYQSLRTIEKSELVTKIEKKFGVDLHDLPNPDDALPISMEGSFITRQATGLVMKLKKAHMKLEIN
eukprot:CAMPEP_0184491810 /NCGR_PEP_ID=MMETSP0113_2-20130426/21405_1 /TAXON_ID=91329 /ORGANISM="Norrisiella sphaerica, Strain BC52" /LENGTH=117 /DNA_ID=CAMNT_0026876335 /DNA_START=174 /DNA_END=527 /DNA_ORIENTATION=+